jgi:L,D-transpeptidase catalytic domain
MQKILPTIFLLLISIQFPSLPLAAQRLTSATNEPVEGSVVCQPGIYPVSPDDCLPLGPSQTLSEIAATGVSYPAVPLPAYSPDSSLPEIPYKYFMLTQEGAAIYLFSSLEDAMASSVSGNKLGPGEVIVSYQDRVENESGVFYHLRSGYWIRGDFGGRLAMHQPFQGLLFSSTPLNGFGWILGDVQSRTGPSFSAPLTGKAFRRYTVVQVYGSQEAEGITWVMIGLNEWLDYRQVARVTPRKVAPKGIPTSRWIEVNLDEQTLAVYQDNKLVFATLTSTGIENLWTRPGIFQIYEKKDSEDMTGAASADDYYHVEDVPWTMYFDEKRALHGAYWHDRFGYPNSHGCVNLSLGDSHWLYNWAKLDDYVYVYDPSGHTPTDPALFGSGAP